MLEEYQDPAADWWFGAYVGFCCGSLLMLLLVLVLQ